MPENIEEKGGRGIERESCVLLISDEKNELADLVRGGIVLEVSFVKGILCMQDYHNVTVTTIFCESPGSPYFSST